jgi:hypothetical protein
VVVAAGNGINRIPIDAGRVSPANCDKVLTVSASNSSGMKTSWANFGTVVDVMAPGEDIYTTSCYGTYSCYGYYGDEDDYEYVSGTSFAAPIVAAVASLALSINPSLTPAELKTLIKASTNPGATCSDGCGTGVIDAYKVVSSFTLWDSSESDLVATYPLTDGYQDEVTVQFDSISGSSATLALLTSEGAQTSVVNWSVTPTQLPSLATYRGTSSVSLDGLAAGDYLVRIDQGQYRVEVPLLIGTGILHSISISKSASAVYPYKDGYLDSATITVTGRDVEGNIIPVLGDVRLNNVPVGLNLSTNTATWNWAAIPKGTREIVASGVGPNASGQSKKTAKTTIVIGRSVATRASITTNVGTVYPVKDNYIDTAAISMTIATNTGKIVPGSGTITVFQGNKKITSWNIAHTKLGAAKKTTVSWNGRVNGKVKQGKFKIVATFKSSEDGKTIKATKNINVSDKKRVLKTKKGKWYTAKKAMNECKSGWSWWSGCAYDGSAVVYWAEDWVETEHRLPLPVKGSSVHSWRLKIDGIGKSLSDYYLYICDDYYCDDYGDKQYFKGSNNKRYTWTTLYTKRGISDGHADWALDGDDAWYRDTFTVYKYQVEVRYWALE